MTPPLLLSRLLVLMARGLARGLAWLPLPLALALGRGLGALAYALIGAQVARRIEPHFPGQGRRIARAHLAHVGMMLCEFLRAPHCPGDLRRVEVRGREHFPPGGAVGLVGHYGNFELIGRAAGSSGYKCADIAEIRDEPLSQFVDQHRQGSGIRFIYITSGSARARARALLEAARLVQEGYTVGFFADQQEGEGIEVEFLGRRKVFPGGAELLAQRTQKPLVASFITRTSGGHVIEILPLPDQEPTKAFAKLLEERVRARPDQYLWL